MKKDASGGLAPTPGYFISQMLQMEEDLLAADEMPFFDMVEYGASFSCKARTVYNGVYHPPVINFFDSEK